MIYVAAQNQGPKVQEEVEINDKLQVRKKNLHFYRKWKEKVVEDVNRLSPKTLVGKLSHILTLWNSDTFQKVFDLVYL